ncbi:cytoskeleton protein RodZ [Thalassotalea sp. 1_MG-2023]|nr:cytoskeleton protein RodZ [Thalassotalea sp. 1_MG-2023]
MTQNEQINEHSEEQETLSPGKMLAQARKKMGLSELDVADRLNFRKALVGEIEQDIFDTSLPSTFNRGYLKNYAKLVNLPEAEVLASYEALNIVSTQDKQGSPMQSFSKETEKQAENSRLMLLTYLILATLVGSSVIWWIQDAKQSQKTEAVDTSSTEAQPTSVEQPSLTTDVDEQPENEIIDDANIAPLAETLKTTTESHEKNIATDTDAEQLSTELTQQADNATPNDVALANEPVVQNSLSNMDAEANDKQESLTPTDEPLVSAQFTFSGDCWVNIYDATGERVAWGIKKTGYVMNISGQAPFKVTLGKPELVAIAFQGDNIDMSQFSRGNIAKFTLPLDAENQAE